MIMRFKVYLQEGKKNKKGVMNWKNVVGYVNPSFNRFVDSKFYCDHNQDLLEDNDRFLVTLINDYGESVCYTKYAKGVEHDH